MPTVDWGTGFEGRATAHLRHGFIESSSTGSMGPGVVMTTGQRSGARCWGNEDTFGSNAYRRFLPQRATRWYTCAFMPAFEYASYPIMWVMDDILAQCGVNMRPDGRVDLVRANGTFNTSSHVVLGTSTGVLPATPSFHLFELMSTIHNSAGAMTLYVDSNPTPLVSVSGVDTQFTANAWADGIGWQGARNGIAPNNVGAKFDDIYTADDRLAFPDQRFLRWGLDGTVGALNGSNPVGSAIRSQNVDEETSNEDGDYNEFDPGEADSYPSDTLGSTSTIRYFIVWQRWKKTGYGPMAIRGGVRIGGVNYDGGVDQYMGTDEYHNQLVYDANLSPATGLPFTEAELNAAEAYATRVA